MLKCSIGQYSDMNHISKLYRYLDPASPVKEKAAVNVKKCIKKDIYLIGKIGNTLKVQK